MNEGVSNEADRPAVNRVYICLGSNIEPEANLPAAVRLLGVAGRVTAASTVYETIPVGFADQANFLNAAVLFETPRELAEVLGVVVPGVEAALRRRRDPANLNGPRTIDLDVALFNDLAITHERRVIPDPDIVKYPFVAIPLAEIAPDYRHPTAGRTLREIAAGLEVAAGDMRPRPDVRLA